MTDIERAEAFANNEYVHGCTKLSFEAAREGFLAGLKSASKEKWHDLRKNPKDLPDACMDIVNQDGEKVRYDYVNEVWRYDDFNDYICDTPIAWCEIPTFTNKDELDEKGYEKQTGQSLLPIGKWHDLRKDPTDLPNDTRNVWTNVGPSYYDSRDNCWRDEFGRTQGVIAWCEPKFEE